MDRNAHCESIIILALWGQLLAEILKLSFIIDAKEACRSGCLQSTLKSNSINSAPNLSLTNGSFSENRDHDDHFSHALGWSQLTFQLDIGHFRKTQSSHAHFQSFCTVRKSNDTELSDFSGKGKDFQVTAALSQ